MALKKSPLLVLQGPISDPYQLDKKLLHYAAFRLNYTLCVYLSIQQIRPWNNPLRLAATQISHFTSPQSNLSVLGPANTAHDRRYQNPIPQQADGTSWSWFDVPYVGDAGGALLLPCLLCLVVSGSFSLARAPAEHPPAPALPV